jgi:NAD(P)-dependent dehydrogenase (short-subunit alcohol dehydrogenase family)
MLSEEFADKVVLVTGASSGIGRTTALAFARQGAKVLVTDVAVAEGEATVEMIKERGGAATFVETDVTREALTADCTKENWDRVIAVNLTGVFLGMKHQIPQMLKQGGGAIVNTASVTGLVGHQNVPAYVASKHGVIGLTKSTALSYARANIRVNVVCPGITMTPMLEHIRLTHSQDYEAMMEGTPMGRPAEPEEVADAIMWLCSGASSYCTGHALVVDGGYIVQ